MLDKLSQLLAYGRVICSTHNHIVYSQCKKDMQHVSDWISVHQLALLWGHTASCHFCPYLHLGRDLESVYSDWKMFAHQETRPPLHNK